MKYLSFVASHFNVIFIRLFLNTSKSCHNCLLVLKTRPSCIGTYIIRHCCLILLKDLIISLTLTVFITYMSDIFPLQNCLKKKKSNNLNLRQSWYLEWFRNPTVTTQSAIVITLMLPRNIIRFVHLWTLPDIISIVNCQANIIVHKMEKIYLVGTSIICFEKQSSLHYNVFRKKCTVSGLCMLHFILWSVLWPLTGSSLPSSLFVICSVLYRILGKRN